MRTNAVIRIILYSLAIVILLGILAVGLGVGLLSFSSMPDDSGESIPGTTGSVDPATVRNLEIKWASGSITIAPGDGADISFYENGVTDTKYQMVWKQRGDTVVIEYCKESLQDWIGFTSGSGLSKDLVISVPSGWICDTLEIDAAAAEVEIVDLTIHELDFDGASGTCTLENCTVGALDLDAASGDVTFSGTLDTLDFDGASASCTLVLHSCPGRIELDGMSGDLDITLPSDCGFAVDMNSMSSGFSSDFSTVTQNGQHIHGDGRCKITIDAMSGDITIRKGTEPCQDHHH